MRIAVVIVNYRTTELVEVALASVRRGYNKTESVRVVIVDGFSNDGTLPNLAKLVQEPRFRDWVELLPLPINGGFGWANNQAILRLLQGPDPPEAIHLLNPDAELLQGSGSALAERLSSGDQIGAVGSQLVDARGNATASAFKFPTIIGEFGRGAATRLINTLLGLGDGAHQPRVTASAVEWVTGASVMIRAAALKDVGLFDDSFFLYHEEVELMWRMRRAGWSVWYEPRSQVRHDGGAATGISDVAEGRVRPRRPGYWYESRRLLFRRFYGRNGPRLAAIAFALGDAILRIRHGLGFGGKHAPILGEVGDYLSSSSMIGDQSAPLTTWRDAPGAPPRWLRS